MTFDATKSAELARQAREDDERMTPGEWTANHGSWASNVTFTSSQGLQCLLLESMPKGDAAGIARTRNNLRAMAEQLEAACQRIAQLEANAITFREYRFALEGIATDGNGNPVDSSTTTPHEAGTK